MHIGENRLARGEAGDPVQSFGKAQMAGMRRVAQGVDDPEIEPGNGRQGFFGKAREIAAIGEIGDAETQRGDVAMGLLEDPQRDCAPRPFHMDDGAGGDVVGVENRGIIAAGWGGEAIAEGFLQTVAGQRIEIDVDAPPVVQGQHAKVIYAMGVVGMGVGVEDGLDTVDIGGEKLLAQVAAGVDQHSRGLVAAGAKPFQQKGTSEAPVARFGRVAGPPDIADAGHAAGRAAAEYGGDDPLGGRHQASPVLANRRAKFAVVSAASWSKLIPRTSASFSAVWRTKAGSLDSPRCGIGAR